MPRHIVKLYSWILTNKDNITQHREVCPQLQSTYYKTNIFYAFYCHNNKHTYICKHKKNLPFYLSPLSMSGFTCTVHHGYGVWYLWICNVTWYDQVCSYIARFVLYTILKISLNVYNVCDNYYLEKELL